MAINMKALARAGAEARVRELLAEIAEIRQAFPGVGGATRGGGRPASEAAAAPAKARKRKPMTAAQRKAVADRMKAYWAGRRRDKKSA